MKVAFRARGEAAVDGSVEERLDDLLWSEPDVERGVDVDVELRLAAAERGEHPESHKLSIAGFQAGSRVDLAEAHATT